MELTSGLLMSKLPTFDDACLIWYDPLSASLGKLSSDFMLVLELSLSIVFNLMETLRRLLLLTEASFGLVLTRMEFNCTLLRSLAANGNVLPALAGVVVFIADACA